MWREFGRKATENRAAARVPAHAGDAALFAEISRMARSTLQVLEMLEYCTRQGVSVHIVKQQLVLDGSIQSRITATVLGLAAEIERELTCSMCGPPTSVRSWRVGCHPAGHRNCSRNSSQLGFRCEQAIGSKHGLSALFAGRWHGM
jgi:Resolvase, N terminal domain